MGQLVGFGSVRSVFHRLSTHEFKSFLESRYDPGKCMLQVRSLVKMFNLWDDDLSKDILPMFQGDPPSFAAIWHRVQQKLKRLQPREEAPGDSFMLTDAMDDVSDLKAMAASSSGKLSDSTALCPFVPGIDEESPMPSSGEPVQPSNSTALQDVEHEIEDWDVVS